MAGQWPGGACGSTTGATNSGQSINKSSSKAVELRVTVVGDGWGPGDMLY